MSSIQRTNRFMLLACAPFFGILIFLFTIQPLMKASAFIMPSQTAFSLQDETAVVRQKLDKANQDGSSIKAIIEKFYKLYDQTNTDVSSILKLAASQVNRPTLVFDGRISNVFGKPIRQANSGNIDIKLYAFYDSNYKGYALKVNLKSNKAMKMVLGKDKLGGSETTLSAVSRYGAIAGINAGGFADDNKGRYPTGNTIYSNKIVYGFFTPDPQIANTFIGLSADLKLIGGRFRQENDLIKLKPAFGASFEPVLLQNGSKQDIPNKWLTSPTRASRTVIGNFKNDQLFIIVADGANESGNSGATLPELQDRMRQVGVIDAYNLDGGGSSTLVFDGDVINKPSDGRMRLLPTNFIFFK
ncbi:MAG: exopolysaccharide biosynthesis protein [Bacilli bacterium]|nr:exopolysaccharide biosynthesis protein [Bacilli bacterium]